jgi:hypothetical protein
MKLNLNFYNKMNKYIKSFTQNIDMFKISPFFLIKKEE